MKELASKFTKADGARLSAFAFSQLTDAGTTILALHNYSNEGNVYMNNVLTQNHEIGLVLAKLAGIALISSLYLRSKNKDADFETQKFGMKNVVIVANVFYFSFSVYNLAVALFNSKYH